jgi:hypothetical protein
MSGARRLLIVGGIALAVWGMGYGLWYAVFAEHQALERIGASLTEGFVGAAEHKPAERDAALGEYRQAKYVYDRQVDVHGHWIGLAMLLIVLGIGFERVGFSELFRYLVAVALLAGAVIFPLGVMMQTWSHGELPRAVAIVGSGLVIGGLGVSAVGVVVRGAARS